MTVNSEQGTANYFPCYDGNGNVTEYLNATGSITAHFGYGPFGETIRATGVFAPAAAFRFSTKYTDAESNLLYYGFRYYSSAVGRWLSRDPLEEDGSLNLLEGMGNDPINMFDVLGQYTWSFTEPVPEQVSEISFRGFRFTGKEYVLGETKPIIESVSLDGQNSVVVVFKIHVSVVSEAGMKATHPDREERRFNPKRILERSIEAEAEHTADFKRWMESVGKRIVADFENESACRCADESIKFLTYTLRNSLSAAYSASIDFWDPHPNKYHEINFRGYFSKNQRPKVTDIESYRLTKIDSLYETWKNDWKKGCAVQKNEPEVK